MTNFLEAKDEFGRDVRIPTENLPYFTLFGMEIGAIAALRQQYLLRRGPCYSGHITKRDVEEVFNV